MWIAALFTVARTWEQPKCPTIAGVVHIYNGILLSHKKGWNTAICDNIDGPWDNHAKQNKLDRKSWKPHGATYMWDINLKATNEQDKQTETHGLGQWTSGYQRGVREQGGGWGKRAQICGDRENSDHGRWTHNAIYVCALLLNRTPESYWISLTNVIKERKSAATAPLRLEGEKRARACNVLTPRVTRAALG